MESVVARDSGVVLVAKRSGYVNQVDASRIVISAIEKKDNDTGVDIYRLSKFQRIESRHMHKSNSVSNSWGLCKRGRYNRGWSCL